MYEVKSLCVNSFAHSGKWQQAEFPTFAQKAMEIQEAQRMVDQWIQEKGIRYFDELTNTAMLTEEVGELARIMARTYGEQSYKESDRGADMGDEMADILFVLICLANQTGIDLTTALEQNLAKKTNRDQDRHRQNPNLNP